MSLVKKPASEKPPGMNDAQWRVFMAHKGEQVAPVGENRPDGPGRLVHVEAANLAVLADFLDEASSRQDFTAQGYTKNRAERIRRGLEGE